MDGRTERNGFTEERKEGRKERIQDGRTEGKEGKEGKEGRRLRKATKEGS